MRSNPETPVNARAWADRVNQAYFGEFGASFGRITRERINWLASEVRGDSVLDVGCSQGILAILLAREGVAVTAIDINPVAISYASEAIAQESETVRQRISLLQSDLASIDETLQFDTIILGEVLEHQTQPERFIRLALRYLKPNGRLLITSPFGVHPWPDHKCTLYPSTLEQILGQWLRVDLIDVRDEYIRAIACNANPSGEQIRFALSATEVAANSFKQELHALEVRHKKLESELKKRVDEIAELTEQRATFSRKAAELAKSLQAKNQSREQLEAKVKMVETDLAAAQTKLDEAEARLNQVTEEKNAFLIERQSLNDAVKLLREEVELNRAEKQSLQQQLQEARLQEQSAKEKGHELGKACENYLREIGVARAEKTNLLGRLQESEERQKKLVTEGQRLQEQHDASAKRWQTANEKNQEALASLRAELTAAGKALERQAEVMEAKTLALENRVQVVREMISFQLGAAILEVLKSPMKAWRLPSTLWKIHLDARQRQAKQKIGEELKQRGSEYRRMLEQLQKQGLEAIRPALQQLHLSPATQAAALTAMGKELYDQLPQIALEAIREAERLDSKAYRAKWLAFRLFEQGALTEPAQLLRQAAASADFSASELKKADEIKVLSNLLTNLPVIPAAKKNQTYEPGERHLLYVTASALPYHTTGYTNRTHELVSALQRDGVQVKVLTRPGYPWDRRDRVGEPISGETTIDGVSYLHRRAPSQNLPLDLYLAEAARVIAKVASEHKAACLHAASNYVNALPALLAARQLGISFQYEMRGLWDLSKATRVPGYENSERFTLGMQLEKLVAQQADRVFVISSALRDHLLEWGVKKDKIHLLPNCVNPQTIQEAKKLAGSKCSSFTVGYAGSLVGYEGVHTLLEALLHLKAEGKPVHARIIGDGPEKERLEQFCRKHHLTQEVKFFGKLPPQQARARLLETHLAVLPRLDYPVCRIIPPLKLTESIALGIPVLASDLPALREESVAGKAFFPAGQSIKLAEKISELSQSLQPNQSSVKVAYWSDYISQMFPDFRSVETTDSNEKKTNNKTEVEDFSPSNIIQIIEAEGVNGVLYRIRSENSDFGKNQRFLIRAASVLRECGKNEDELHLLSEALNIIPSLEIAYSYFTALAKQGNFPDAIRVASVVSEFCCNGKNEGEEKRILEIKKSPVYHFLHGLSYIPEKPPEPQKAHKGHICYVLHNSLPYASGGYATRALGVASGLRKAGFEVTSIARPGFPRDTKKNLGQVDILEEQFCRGIRYIYSDYPLRSNPDYIQLSAGVFAEKFLKERPEVVIAASAYLSALPALIAARRLGIPFIYEVRGLWEITTLSRRGQKFAEQDAFKAQVHVEGAIARMADHVFTLTQPMKEELLRRGVQESHVTLLPNSCDPERFLPRPCDKDLKQKLGVPEDVPVIGYIGTFVDYEGLENLVEACCELKRRGRDFRLLLVGNENTSGSGFGPITEKIHQYAREVGLSDWIILPGRIPHEEVESYYSIIDVCPFPRKPLPVCEMVSPMKPLEALAMEKAVVVSSVRALTEMISHEKTGLVFEKGSINSLADMLDRLLLNPELRCELGRKGRQWVEQERTWKQVGEKAARVIQRVVAEKPEAVPLEVVS